MPSKDDQDFDFENSFTAKAVTFVAKGLLLFMWCTVGLLVWLALLIRGMVVVTVVVMISLIGKGDIRKTFRKFDYIASLWPHGLNQIMNIRLTRLGNEHHGTEPENEKLTTETVFRFLMEVTYTAVFFLTLYWVIFGFPDLKPYLPDDITREDVARISIISGIVGAGIGAFLYRDDPEGSIGGAGIGALWMGLPVTIIAGVASYLI